MIKGAQISGCGLYRYSLCRIWKQQSADRVIFIGLNPSTADAKADDPTIRRCIGFAKSWGFGGLYMLNLFAFRATDPAVLKKAADPIGPQNNEYLKMSFEAGGQTIACWGVHGAFLDRGAEVIELLGQRNLSCLGLTAAGHPKHPLYLKKSTQPKSLSKVLAKIER